MRIYIVLAAIFLLCGSAMPQKPVLANAPDRWPIADNIKISNNGNYVVYTGIPGPQYMTVKNVVEGFVYQRAIDKRAVAPSNFVFSADNRWLIFKGDSDSLFFLNLQTMSETFVGMAFSYKMYERDGATLIGSLNSEGILTVRNFSNKEEIKYKGVKNYFFISGGQSLLIQRTIKDSSQLILADIADGLTKNVWSGGAIKQIEKDENGGQFVFSIETMGEAGKPKGSLLWYYKTGEDTAHVWLDARRSGLARNIEILSYGFRFNKNGDRLFLQLTKVAPAPIRKDLTGSASFQISDYRDLRRNPEQATAGAGNMTSYIGVATVGSSHIVQLSGEGEVRRDASRYRLGYNEDIILLGPETIFEQMKRRYDFWSKPSPASFYIVSTIDGCRKKIETPILLSSKSVRVQLSPEGRYVTWWNDDEGAYYVYDIKSGKTVNVSKHIPVPVFETVDRPRESVILYGYQEAAWGKDERYLFLYDQYDIWRLDPTGNSKPVNLTRGYGRRNHIIFRLSNAGQQIIDDTSTVLLSAFNYTNKYNGFYRLSLNKDADPELLTMGPYVYNIQQLLPSSEFVSFGFPPIKAGTANVYVVRRMSATDAPNYFLTKDFKTYTPLTNSEPQKAYNWLTATLVRWKKFDGQPGQGILYKPENFDSAKKYPVIFYFYERLADGLYEFKNPQPYSGHLNIPLAVSNGYLVFIPDISYSIGATGQSVVNSVVSAAEALSKNDWIDKDHMGIQGFSYGAFEVNYLVTHSKIFAAASSASGVSDLISSYTSGLVRMFHAEIGQGRIGGTLWEFPERYIANSPVLKADQVVAPMLFVSNKADPDVPYMQGIEFFNSLKRLEKKAWLLQYDKSGHTLVEPDNLDYNKRMMQFFDHYLKDHPAPIWMTRVGEKGFELDPLGKCGKDCKICRSWSNKVQMR